MENDPPSLWANLTTTNARESKIFGSGLEDKTNSELWSERKDVSKYADGSWDGKFILKKRNPNHWYLYPPKSAVTSNRSHIHIF